MLQSRTVLGLSAGVVDVANEPQKSGLSVVLDAIKNPLHAALLVMVYFVWWTTAKVDKAQDDIKRELAVTTANTAALVKSNEQATAGERRREAIMRMICRGVNKGQARDACDQ
jgi:hypothetical protein